MTIKDLKEEIENLPDDMLVKGLKENGRDYDISLFTITKDTLTEEEIEDGYPNGVEEKLLISIG